MRQPIVYYFGAIVEDCNCLPMKNNLIIFHEQKRPYSKSALEVLIIEGGTHRQGSIFHPHQIMAANYGRCKNLIMAGNLTHSTISNWKAFSCNNMVGKPRK